MFDLVLRGGRVIDPGSGRDEPADVAFADGRVAAVGPGLHGTRERDVSGCIVMPGNIDFHAHVYWGGTSISVDADRVARRCGTTTWLDAGSAGPGNFAGFRAHVIEPESDADSGLSARRACGDLCVLAHGDAGREPRHAADGHRELRGGGAGSSGADPRGQGADRGGDERAQWDRAAVQRARSGRAGRVAGDVPYRSAATAVYGRAGGVAAGRYADALLSAVPECADPCGWAREGGVLGGAGTGGAVRRRAWRRVVRFCGGGGDADGGVPARRDQLGPARDVCGWPGVRQHGDDEQVPAARDAADGDRAGGDADAGAGAGAARSGRSDRGEHRRCDRDADRGGVNFSFQDVVGQTRQARQRFALDSMVVAGAIWHEAG